MLRTSNRTTEMHSIISVRTKCKWVRFQLKVGANFNIEQDFHKFILVVDEVEKSKEIHNEINILINTNDKVPDPAVIETAEEDYKEVPKGLAKSKIRLYKWIRLRIFAIACDRYVFVKAHTHCGCNSGL